MESQTCCSPPVYKYWDNEYKVWEIPEMRGVCNLLQLYLTLYDPMDCSLPGSFVRGILQATLLEWVALHVSRGSFSRRDWSWISYVSCNWQAGSLPPAPPEKPNPRDTFSQISSQIRKIFSMDFLLNKPHESRASYRSTEAGDNRIERLKCKGRESEEIMAHFILDLQRPTWGFPDGSVGKESFCNAGDTSSISGSGRSPGGGHGNTLQYCGLENPMDRGAWWATVHGVAKSWTRLKQLSTHRQTVQWLSS